MSYDIGNKSLDVKTNIRYIDTLTVLSYTVMMDSIQTSNLAYPAIVVGKYSDPEFGDIAARSFFRVVLPNSSWSLPNDAVYDSIQLFLLYNGYYTGDTTATYTIKVHQLMEALRPNEDGYFYNTSTVSYSSDNVDSLSFVPRPNSNDTVWINLNDSFGNELFGLLREKDYRVQSTENFLTYLKGFALNYGGSNKAIIGFKYPTLNDEPKYPAMRLYYHHHQYETVHKHLDFIVQRSDYNLQFNQFAFCGQPVVNFPQEQKLKLPANAANNYRSYILAGVGIITRLEIPYLKNLLDFNDNIRIMAAELQLEPVKNTYKTFRLPQELSLYTSDSQNRFTSAIKDKNGNVQTAYLYKDQIYQLETRYTFDITDFLESKLKQETNELPSLLFTVKPDNLYETLDRLVLGSQLNAINKVKLKVYYMFYE
jgi:hypothetical protein